MVRIAIGIEYFGADFNGWQAQDHGRTVQQTVEAALSEVADHSITLQCAGRTDTGVHALHQIAHFDTTVAREPRSWLLGTNTHLPFDVNLLWAKAVSEDFHARFSAVQRRYRYVILNRSSRSSVLHQRVSFEARPLELKRMQAAATALIGEHDFTSFRALACQAKSPIRTIEHLELFATGDYIVLDIQANAFLQHMVRNIAGVLMEVGMGKRDVDWVSKLLSIRDRTQGGVTAPAAGLYLVDVTYPATFDIPRVDEHLWPLSLIIGDTHE